MNRPLSRGGHFVSGDLKSFVYARLALSLPRQNGRRVRKVYNNNRSQFALTAPFYCYQQVVIFSINGGTGH